MAWDEEEDTTTYKDLNNDRVQEVITLVKQDSKLTATVRADPRKALAPYKLNTLEIQKVADYFRR